MSEAQNIAEVENKATIDVVCDHCSTGYHVSILHFKDSYKHRFECENCGQSWVEYLDTRVWQELRVPIMEIVRREEARLEAERKKQQEAQAAHLAAERAKRKAEEERRAEQEALQAEQQAIQESEAAAEAQAAAEYTQKVEDFSPENPALEEDIEASDEIKQESTEPEEPSEESVSADDTQNQPVPDQPPLASNEPNIYEGAMDSQPAAELEMEPKQSADTNPPKLDALKKVKSVLVYVHPKKWGEFSLPLVLTALFLTLAMISGSASYFYTQRSVIVKNNPLAAKTYAMLGIRTSPVEGFQVKIEEIERKDILIPGEKTQFDYYLRAEVHNVSGLESRVPYARLSVFDVQGRKLSSWDINLTGRVLQNDEGMNLAVLLPESMIGNERVDSFEVRLISKLEREILGESPLLENQATS